MELTLLLSPPGSSGARFLLGVETQPVPRLAGVGRVPLEDLELLEQGPAAGKPASSLVAVRRTEPVAGLDPAVPGADPVELHPDLVGLRVGVVVTEVLELDLLPDVSVAVLDDVP